MKGTLHQSLRQAQASDCGPPRKGAFNPFSDLSGIRPASEEASVLPSTAASFLYPKSEPAADRWEEVCICQECKGSRLCLSELQEHPPSFRASPKFQDTPKTETSLTAFLADVGLQSLEPVLTEHEVTLADLFLLTREDLADMKIPIGPRNRLLNVLQKNKAEDPELDSPKQALTVKPASPEKYPQHAPVLPPFQMQRRQLNEEVESFMQELDELLNRSQRKRADLKPEVKPEMRPEVKPEIKAEVKPEGKEARPASSEQMQMLQSLLSGRDALEKGLESVQKSLSDLKENRTSRDTSPTLRARASPTPSTKVPLHMKRGLINRLK